MNEEVLAEQLALQVGRNLKGFELRLVEIELPPSAGLDSQALSKILCDIFSKNGHNRARVRISEKKAGYSCSACKSEFYFWKPAGGPEASSPASCPKCGSLKIEPTSPSQVEIKRIEVWPTKRR